jgi:hypothetical protein
VPAADVDFIAAVGGTATGVKHPKLRDLVPADLLHYTSIEAELCGFDAPGANEAGPRVPARARVYWL